MIDEQFRELLRKLHRKANEGKVNWIACHGDPPGLIPPVLRDDVEDVFAVEFGDPKARIEIKYGSPAGAPDWARADMFIDGKRAASITAEDGSPPDLYAVLSDLWSSAHESVYGWKAALAKIEASLESADEIGVQF